MNSSSKSFERAMDEVKQMNRDLAWVQTATRLNWIIRIRMKILSWLLSLLSYSGKLFILVLTTYYQRSLVIQSLSRLGECIDSSQWKGDKHDTEKQSKTFCAQWWRRMEGILTKQTEYRQIKLVSIFLAHFSILCPFASLHLCSFMLQYAITYPEKVIRSYRENFVVLEMNCTHHHLQSDASYHIIIIAQQLSQCNASSLALRYLPNHYLVWVESKSRQTRQWCKRWW